MNIKEFLTEQISLLEEKRKSLREGIVNGETAEDRAAANDALQSVEKDLENFRAQLANVDKPEGELNVISTMTTSDQRKDDADYEKRKAFQNFVAYQTEERANEVTKTTDTNVSTAIPQNLIDEIYTEMENYGDILSRIQQTSYPVGQQIPVDNINIVATWTGRNNTTPASSTTGEGVGSESQKGVLAGAVIFSHFKLRCEVAFTKEVGIMTLDAFEKLFVKKVVAAMVKALEAAVVSGDGYGQPTGILTETPVTGQALETPQDETTGNYLDYGFACEMEAAIPEEAEETAVWVMTKKSFMKFVGMVDDNGQPIARINYGISGKPERTILGREVLIYKPQAGSLLGTFNAKPEADTICAFAFDFGKYVLNKNYEISVDEKDEWSDETHHIKAVLACDGKSISKTSLVTVTAPEFE